MGAHCCADQNRDNNGVQVVQVPVPRSFITHELRAPAPSCESIGERLAAYPMALIGFELEDGGRIEVEVTKKPLGIDFEKRTPLKVKSVRSASVGEELQIRTGWIIASVNNEVIKGMDYPNAVAKLRTAMASIPIAEEG
mmetsp:Transcript_143244/g.399328  ORF Transcript_143244/g.399328 Transcript_143244/m.399328 type:complete len:139 (+) Transcript_143244:55-471(+)